MCNTYIIVMKMPKTDTNIDVFIHATSMQKAEKKATQVARTCKSVIIKINEIERRKHDAVF